MRVFLSLEIPSSDEGFQVPLSKSSLLRKKTKKDTNIHIYLYIYVYYIYIYFFLWKYYTTPSCKFTESASQGAMASCSEISKLSKRLIPSTMRCAAVICKLSRKAPVQTSSSPILPCIQGWVAPVSGVWPRARRISVFPGRSL